MFLFSRGKKFEPLIENLDEKQYPLKDLYTIGFVWSSSKLFSLSGKKLYELKSKATLLYDYQYSEYYANVIWAQSITLVHLSLAVSFLITGAFYDFALYFFAVGMMMSFALGYYTLENLNISLDKRAKECESQLPEVVSTMAILVNSGMFLRDAWNMIAENGNGVFYELMRKASDNMKNGSSDEDAIYLFGRASNSVNVKKFTSALLQSLEKGGADLSIFLTNQSSELWNVRKQHLLQEGEKASSKLLAPILFIFIGVIIIVITAAFSGSLF